MPSRGYAKLYAQEILGADEGCDFAFLRPLQREGGRNVKVESVKYSVSGLGCSGELVYDDSVKTQRPLLLVAPNWLGVTKDVIERAKTLAGTRYVAFVADMFGEGKGPKGNENPMEFLKPLIEDAAETPPAHRGGVRHDDEGGDRARHRRRQAARRASATASAAAT